MSLKAQIYCGILASARILLTRLTPAVLRMKAKRND